MHRADSRGTDGEIEDDNLTTVERQHRRAMEYEEDEDNIPVNIHRVVHTLSVPNQSTLRSSDDNVRVGYNKLICYESNLHLHPHRFGCCVSQTMSSTNCVLSTPIHMQMSNQKMTRARSSLQTARFRSKWKLATRYDGDGCSVQMENM